MKKIILFLSIVSASILITNQGNAQILKKVKDKVNQKADEKVDKTIDKGSEETAKTEKKEKKDPEKTETDQVAENKKQDEPSIKTYQNYDFVPGDKILFEDHFTDDADGEFATHWELKSGQAVLNKLQGELALYMIDGNYVRVSPRMKSEKYLSEPFTIEYDYYFIPGAYGLIVMLKGFDKELGFVRESSVQVSRTEVSFSGASNGVSLLKNLPPEMSENFENKWHHIAIAVKNHQLKVYIDQFRMLSVPDTKEVFESFEFAGIGSEQSPIIFKNLRIAAGGNMNLVGKKFTDGKIVTHGINFDIDKATIKPESMGTLNMIVQVMKDNPDVKFEVGGHTDNTGTAQHNLTLSQQRADAVKDQLTKMGVDASRLSAKGFGDSLPIGENTTLEGRANNRRVEFVKK